MSKKAQNPQFFTLLTSKCASRHNSVHFSNIRTSKSGANMWCFVHFDFEMCFAPQRRALFRHRNFQKWSENGVFCTFWLGNVLRATTACTFSTSQLPKVVRSSSVLSILTWKCASRHNGVHFFMSYLASWLRTRRFSEPTFRPSGATNHWKNTVFRDVPTFSRTCIFFLLIFSLLTLLTSAFQLSILSEVSLLNFLRSYSLSMSKCIVYHRLRLDDRVYVFLFGRFCLHLRHWLQKWQWHEGVDSVDSVDGKCFGWPCWTTVDRVCCPASKTFRTNFASAMLRPCFGNIWKLGFNEEETMLQKPYTLNQP